MTSLTEDERAKAAARFERLCPFLEAGVSLKSVATRYGVSLRTVRRWVRRYRQDGFAGLVRKPRTDRGRHRSLTTEFQALIEGLALRTPPPNVAFVHRKVGGVARDQGWHVPSYGCVYDVIRRLDPALVTLAHAGPEVYREAFDTLHRHETSHPNAIWQAGRTLLDIWFLDDAGQVAHPWLTIILDDYSRVIAGYVLAF